MRDFTINDNIRFSNGSIGTVRFMGMLKDKEGIWVGLELDKPWGKNAGELDGVKYFNTEEKHGLFVRKDLVDESLDFREFSSSISESVEEVDYKRLYEKEHLKRKIQETNFTEKIARIRKRKILPVNEKLDEIESATSFFVKIKYAGLLDEDHLSVIKLVRTMIAKLKDDEDISKELEEYKKLLTKENIKLNI